MPRASSLFERISEGQQILVDAVSKNYLKSHTCNRKAAFGSGLVDLYIKEHGFSTIEIDAYVDCELTYIVFCNAIIVKPGKL